MDKPEFLPRPLTAFVGRQQELADLGQRLADPACRLLTLTGPGGIGKTRLALAAAEAHHHHFADGVFFVNLQYVYDSDVLVSTIAETAHIPLVSTDEPLEQLSYGLKNRRVLLILDNFEQLLDSSAIVLTLLQETTATLLVTSREPLNIQEEWLYPVHGLTFDQNDASAIALFADRAGRVKPHFDLAANHLQVQQICQLVEGMPLAIELAAAWSRTLTPSEIIAEIKRNLDFLTARLRNLPTRHRSIERVFQQTWQQMDEEAQHVFARLSIFHGGFLREAAAEVAGATLPLLSDFIDKSLIRWEHGSEDTAGGRYQIHELLRQYAAVKLNENHQEAHQTLDRFRNFYAAYIAARFDDLTGLRQSETIAEIRPELENLRATWEAALKARDGEQIEMMIMPLMSFFWYDGRYREALNFYQRGIDDLLKWPPSPIRDLNLAMLYTNNSWIIMAQGDIYGSIALAEKSFALYQSLGRCPVPGVDTDPELVIGLNHFFLHDYKTALAFIERAQQTAAADDHQLNLQMSFRLMGMIYPKLGQPETGRQKAHQGLALAEQLGDRGGMAYAHEILGDIAGAQKKLTEAEYHYSRCYEIRKKMEFELGLGDILQKLGYLALRKRDATAARDYLSRCLRRFGVVHIVIGEVATLIGLAHADLLDQNLVGARAHLDQVFERTDENFAHHLAVALRLLTVGGNYLLIGGHTAAAYHFLGAAYFHPEIGDDQIELIRSLVPVEKLPRKEDRPIDKYIAELKTALLIPFPHPQPDTVSAPQPLLDPLTPRELEVLQLVAKGHTNKQIADTLFLSVGTVKSYTSHIYSKLGVSHRTQAVAEARQLGII